jgi:hypothetical protein
MADRAALLLFCEEHLEQFTSEGLRYALQKQPAPLKREFLARLKRRRKGKILL